MSIAKGGTAFAGVPIGILVLNAKYPLIPGNVANAKSYQFPVCFEVVDLPTRWWFELNEEKYQIFLQAAKRLEEKGVRAIICDMARKSSRRFKYSYFYISFTSYTNAF